MSYNFKNLVFEGGGVKGIAYGGALKVLDSMNILPGIKRVAGTSAGAINAALLALGYSYKEVSDIIASTQFRSFQDKSWFLPANVLRFLFRYGYFIGNSFSSWLGDKIKAKSGNADLTFAELHAMAGTKNFKELYVIATNLSEQKAEVLSHRTYPSLRIKDAVRMSMSIPFFFKAIRNEKKSIMVDGGVSWNYPINLFDYKEFLDNPANSGDASAYAQSPEYVFNYETLGMRLDSKSVIEYAKHEWALSPEPINNIKTHAGALVNFMMEIANKSHLKKNDWNRTIFIDTLDVKTTQFDLSDEKIKELIASGEAHTQNYFNWRNSDPEWSIKPQ